METENNITVFVAASLNNAMKEIVEAYNEDYPDVKVTLCADSSGTLMTQILEGYECDVFFSASEDQMDRLEEEGFVVDGSRLDVVGNQLVVITYKGSKTDVTDLMSIGNAKSIALADGSVPVGKYTRQALVALNLLDEKDDPSSYTTAQIQLALKGPEISEQSNVSKVLTAVAEHSCQIGTTYLSDTYGYEDEIDIIEKVSRELTGDVTYPIAQIVNKNASEEQSKAASEFISFVKSDKSKNIFDQYLFDTSLQ